MSAFIIFGLLKIAALIASRERLQCVGRSDRGLIWHQAEGNRNSPGMVIVSKIIYFFFKDRGDSALVAFMLGMAVNLMR